MFSSSRQFFHFYRLCSKALSPTSMDPLTVLAEWPHIDVQINNDAVDEEEEGDWVGNYSDSLIFMLIAMMQIAFSGQMMMMMMNRMRLQCWADADDGNLWESGLGTPWSPLWEYSRST